MGTKLGVDPFEYNNPSGLQPNTVAPGSSPAMGVAGPTSDQWPELVDTSPQGSDGTIVSWVTGSIDPEEGGGTLTAIYYSDNSVTYLVTGADGSSIWWNVPWSLTTLGPDDGSDGSDGSMGPGDFGPPEDDGTGDGSPPGGPNDGTSDNSGQRLADNSVPNPPDGPPDNTGTGTPSDDGVGGGDEGPPVLPFLGGYNRGGGGSSSPKGGDTGWGDATAGEEEWGLQVAGFGNGGGPSGPGSDSGGWGDSSSDESPGDINPAQVRGGPITHGADDEGWGDLNNPRAFTGQGAAAAAATAAAGLMRLQPLLGARGMTAAGLMRLQGRVTVGIMRLREQYM
jgi:hypothetical protein